MNKKQTMNAGKKRILVVDDLHSDTQLLKRYLERNHNYIVREENNPAAALAAAEEFRPHLILLDVMMPGMNGGEVAAGVQAHSKLKDVPIVFLTAKLSKQEVRLFGGKIGKSPFLAKPIVLREVVDCLKAQLGD